MAFDFVLLAAGQGKRLRPITNSYPKTMVRILDKPLLEWIVEGIIKEFGPQVGKIIIVVGFEKAKITEYFSKHRHAQKIVFVEQKEMRGTAHALLQAEKLVETLSFFIMNADTFFDPSIFKTLNDNSKTPFIVAKREEDASAYGVVEAEGGNMVGLVEKPLDARNKLINTGTLFVPRGFFEFARKVKLSKRNEYEITDAILDFAKGSKLRVLEFASYWTDVGYFWNYLAASEYALTNLMEQSIEGKIEEFVVVKGKIHVGKGSVVKAGTYIEGNVFIGENSVVGPNAYLRKGVVIEDNCHVGNSTEVKSSIIMHNSNAAHLSYIGDSIICENVNFGAGTKIANLKFDHSQISIKTGEEKVGSGRDKLGAVIGKNTKTGINVSINCGIFIGENCRISPAAYVYNNLENDSNFKG
ncbi:NTP transferase domain-containing protein [Candidatus Micrarchaeota archaeon]|nr:NTP transferase domain-containing protein [Candidatus Micrarchaeota archaeon]